MISAPSILDKQSMLAGKHMSKVQERASRLLPVPRNLSSTASESHSRCSAKSPRCLHSPSSPHSPKTPMHGMLHSPIQKLSPQEWGGNGSSDIVESTFVSQRNKYAPQWRQMSIVRRYRSWFESDFMCLKLRIWTR